MQTFKTIPQTKLASDRTNVLACQAETCPDATKWAPVPDIYVRGMDQLWTQAGVRYFGRL